MQDFKEDGFAPEVVADQQKELRGRGSRPFIAAGKLIAVTTSTADTNVVLTHNLGRVPVGYIVAKADKAGSLYMGSGTIDTAVSSIKFSTATTVLSIWVF